MFEYQNYVESANYIKDAIQNIKASDKITIFAHIFQYTNIE